MARIPWRKVCIRGGGVLVGLLFIVQIFYPSSRVLPFVRVDGQNIAGQTKRQATALLNAQYAQYKVALYMGNDSKPIDTPSLSSLAITVDNTERIGRLQYPWYLRIIPSSLFWAGRGVGDPPSPRYGTEFEAYVDKTLMPECRKAPINATLKASGDILTVVSAQPGGECHREDVIKQLKAIRPLLTNQHKVTVAQRELSPAISNATAQAEATQINDRIKNGVQVRVGDETITLAAKDVISWLDVTAADDTLRVAVGADRAGSALGKSIAPKVAITPGVSRITTVDFTETERVNGAPGRVLDISRTAASISAVVNGTSDSAQAITKTVPPTESYTRSYSPTDAGLSALLTNYAKDHTGTFGISLIELDGKKRRANYNGDQQFVTASTYKLLVAYSLLKRIDAGTKDWDSNADCFNKMISLSDNACAEAFLNGLGLSNVSKDINTIGLTNSTFMKTGGPFATANDLALLLGMLQSGQNFSTVNRDRLIGAMQKNIFRKGIPAGANGTVADKVGFMDDLLHDAAIVSGPSGTYVLVIMTKGSSWATIADLAGQIDKLRAT